MTHAQAGFSRVQVLSATLMALALGFSIASFVAEKHERELVSDQEALRGRAMARLAANACTESMMTRNYEGIGLFVRGIVRGDPEIASVRVEVPNGTVVAEAFADEHTGAELATGASTSIVRVVAPISWSRIPSGQNEVMPPLVLGQLILGFEPPGSAHVQTAGTSWLALQIGLSITALATCLCLGSLRMRRRAPLLPLALASASRRRKPAVVQR